MRTRFDDYLAEQLKDPQFKKGFEREKRRLERKLKKRKSPSGPKSKDKKRNK